MLQMYAAGLVVIGRLVLRLDGPSRAACPDGGGLRRVVAERRNPGDVAVARDRSGVFVNHCTEDIANVK